MSEIINLNNTTPAAPTGYTNVSWQKSSTSSGTDPATGLPIYPVSACYTTSATTTAAIVSALPGKPAAGQEVLIWAVDRSTTFPANFAGSVGGFGPNGAHPTATTVYTVYNNSTQVGTITISTSGGFTFATTSGATVTPAVGSVVSVVAPGTQDATMASVAFSLQAQRAL